MWNDVKAQRVNLRELLLSFRKLRFNSLRLAGRLFSFPFQFLPRYA